MIIESLINGFDMIMEMLQSGGVITYIILLLGIYGLLISIRKIFYLRKISKLMLQRLWGQLPLLWNKAELLKL